MVLLSLLLPDPEVVLLDLAPLDIGGLFTLLPPRFVLLLLLIDPVPEPVVDIEPAAVEPAALRSVFAPPMPVELPVLLFPVDVEPWTLVAGRAASFFSLVCREASTGRPFACASKSAVIPLLQYIRALGGPPFLLNQLRDASCQAA